MTTAATAKSKNVVNASLNLILLRQISSIANLGLFLPSLCLPCTLLYVVLWTGHGDHLCRCCHIYSSTYSKSSWRHRTFYKYQLQCAWKKKATSSRSGSNNFEYVQSRVLWILRHQGFLQQQMICLLETVFQTCVLLRSWLHSFIF